MKALALTTCEVQCVVVGDGIERERLKSLAAALGIDTVFTLVGDHLNEVLAEAARAGMRIIDMRHESGVTHAADAWGRTLAWFGEHLK